jgi:hypothetical protein
MDAKLRSSNHLLRGCATDEARRRAAEQFCNSVLSRMPDVASLRLRAFSIKLALRRVSAFYHALRAAHLLEAVPEPGELAAASDLKVIFNEFKDLHARMESMLFDEMARLAVEAESAVNAYVRIHYGFAPGDVIQVPFPRPGTLPVRIAKVFLQSGAESDIRVDGAIVQRDGSVQAIHWDIYLKAPGQFQPEKIQIRERPEGR